MTISEIWDLVKENVGHDEGPEDRSLTMDDVWKALTILDQFIKEKSGE